jgi:hypothetical protein
VSFLAREGRVAINGSIEVPGANMLDLSDSLDLLRGGVWQLDPIFKEVVINPIDELVDTFTAALMRPVRPLLFGGIEDTLNNPVISLDTKDFAPESETRGSTQNSQSLECFLELVSLFLTEGDASPFENACLILNVGDDKGLVLSQESLVFLGEVIVHLYGYNLISIIKASVMEEHSDKFSQLK